MGIVPPIMENQVEKTWETIREILCSLMMTRSITSILDFRTYCGPHFNQKGGLGLGGLGPWLGPGSEAWGQNF